METRASRLADTHTVGAGMRRWRSVRVCVAAENWLSRMKDGPGQYEGVVTQLGTTYRGELSFIVGRAPVEGA